MIIRLCLAQVNTTVGDIPANVQKITETIAKARELGADVVVFPEMAVTGYPPEDLLLKADFLATAGDAIQKIADASTDIVTIVGAPVTDPDVGNGAVVVQNGAIHGTYRKQLLPNYGVFDEYRYYKPGTDDIVFELNGFTIGVNVCEDIWYAEGPARDQATHGGARLLINLSASPWSMLKGAMRERMLSTRAFDHNVYVAYCNLVGGQDELVFDGQSVVFGPDGSLIARGQAFEEELVTVDLECEQVFRTRLFDARVRRIEEIEKRHFHSVPIRMNEIDRSPIEAPVAAILDPLVETYRALVLAVRDYVRKGGFTKVVLGSSGGVDSALTATIACDALGAENVTCIAMPTRYSSDHSLSDAAELARNLGCHHHVLPIDNVFQSFLDMLDPLFAGTQPGLTEENIQPRVRGTTLMALSNKFGWLVLTTGNKSEIAVGYSTLYGDTAGGYSVLKDVPKTLVYRLCRYRNGMSMAIPENILTKAPSAELRPDQKDTDSLPDYEILDPIIQLYVEKGYEPKQIVESGFDPATVDRVVRLIDRNEYKRRQSPPGVKITSRAFGKDWRLPITNHYRPS